MVKHKNHYFTRANKHVVTSSLIWKRVSSLRLSVVSDYPPEYNCSMDFDHFLSLTEDAK